MPFALHFGARIPLELKQVPLTGIDLLTRPANQDGRALHCLSSHMLYSPQSIYSKHSFKMLGIKQVAGKQAQSVGGNQCPQTTCIFCLSPSTAALMVEQLIRELKLQRQDCYNKVQQSLCVFREATGNTDITQQDNILIFLLFSAALLTRTVVQGEVSNKLLGCTYLMTNYISIYTFTSVNPVEHLCKEYHNYTTFPFEDHTRRLLFLFSYLTWRALSNCAKPCVQSEQYNNIIKIKNIMVLREKTHCISLNLLFIQQTGWREVPAAIHNGAGKQVTESRPLRATVLQSATDRLVQTQGLIWPKPQNLSTKCGLLLRHNSNVKHKSENWKYENKWLTKEPSESKFKIRSSIFIFFTLADLVCFSCNMFCFLVLKNGQAHGLC